MDLTRLSNFNSERMRLFCAGCLLVLTFMMCIPALAEGARIVKWKDEKGVTHYGDKIPAQYSNSENSVINKQGVTVKHNKPANTEAQTLNLAKIEQDKKDRALLAAFSHENEIDLARDRNLQLDQLSLEGLELQKNNTQKRYVDMQKYAIKYSQKKQALPEDLKLDMQKNQDEFVKLSAQIAERKAMMAATRKRFDDDKARYIYLKNYADAEGRTP